MEMGIRLVFGGKDFLITADKVQILDLLLSSYEESYYQNIELRHTRSKLEELNGDLEAQVLERTRQLAIQEEQFRTLAENTPDTLQAVVHTYLEPITGGEPTAQQAVEDLAYTLLRLRENRVRENLDQLRYLGQDLQEQADMRANLDEMTLQFTGTLNRLLKALKMPFAPPK